MSQDQEQLGTNPPEPSKDAAPTDQTSTQPLARPPFKIAVLALQNTTLFPETVVPLAVGRPRSVAAVEAALATEEKLIACITARPGSSAQDAKSDDLYSVGSLVMIKRMERLEDTMHIIVQGTDRIKVVEWKQNDPFLSAFVQILDRKSVV